MTTSGKRIAELQSQCSCIYATSGCNPDFNCYCKGVFSFEATIPDAETENFGLTLEENESMKHSFI